VTIASLQIIVHVLLAAEPAAAASSGETILWFGPSSPAVDGAALLDAVSVYTRDLRVAVSAVEGVPAPAAPDARARAVAEMRARGARLGFWCEAQAGGDAAMILTTVDPAGRLEARPVEGKRSERPELYRAVALKLRAALAAVVAGETAAPAGPNATPSVAAPAATPATASTSASASASSPAPTSSPAALARPSVVVSARSEPERPARWLASAAYAISAPLSGGGGIRHALAVEGARAIGPVVELAAGAELGTRVSDGAASGSVSVFDLPVWVAARAVRRGPRLALAGGAFAAAHFLWATATATSANGGAQATAFDVAGGAGAEALARAKLGRGVAAQLRLYVEAALPGTRYWVGDTPVLAHGARLGAALGLAFPAP
jgi:hypothetical protein